jgi:protein-disulfide isomerase
VIAHYPISTHRFAMKAAKASECAAVQGRFREAHDVLLAQQDSFGLKLWSGFAADFNVPSIERFEQCLADTSNVEMIVRGLKMGDKLGLRGTPMVILNGLRFDAAPNEVVLRDLIDSILTHGDPK